MKITLLCVGALILIYFSGFIKAVDVTPKKSSSSIGSPTSVERADAKNVTSGLCECGAFPTSVPSSELKPSIAHPTINVTCDESGKEKCNKMCTALAETAKERGPIVLCVSLKHAIKYKPFVFDRICGSETWDYTGLTFDLEVCCHESKPVDCKNMTNASTT